MIYDLFQAILDDINGIMNGINNIMNDIDDIMNDKKGPNIMNDIGQLCTRQTVYVLTMLCILKISTLNVESSIAKCDSKCTYVAYMVQ